MNEKIVTKNSEETKGLAQLLAMEILSDPKLSAIICLSGELGAGKTTFSQGLLTALGASGPYTSPTFAIMKEYKNGNQKIYHIDAYRIEEKDMLDLGWKDFAGQENCVTIVEWADKIKNIIPKNALWLDFKWLSENEREITIKGGLQ